MRPSFACMAHVAVWVLHLAVSFVAHLHTEHGRGACPEGTWEGHEGCAMRMCTATASADAAVDRRASGEGNGCPYALCSRSHVTAALSGNFTHRCLGPTQMPHRSPRATSVELLEWCMRSLYDVLM